MSTHNIFMEKNKQSYPLIIIKYQPYPSEFIVGVKINQCYTSIEVCNQIHIAWNLKDSFVWFCIP